MSSALKRYRAEKQYSLQHVAELLDVSAATVSRIENDKQTITADMAVAIEKATGGAVKRSDLRDDLWPKPENAEAQQ